MMMLLLMISLIGWVQDPDRSTPEKTCEQFLRFKPKKADLEYLKIGKDIEDMWLSLHTKEWRSRQRKGVAEPEPTLVECIVTAKTEQPNKDVSVEMKAIYKDSENRTLEGFNRFVVTKVENLWLIREWARGCGTCGASGKCVTCGGDGKVDEKPCEECLEGKCPKCMGQIWAKMEYSAKSLFLILKEPPPDLSHITLSSPQESAQAYADLLIRMRVDKDLRTLGEWKAMEVRKVKLFFIPKSAQDFEQDVARAVELAKKRFEQFQIQIESVQEQGEEVAAVLLQSTPSRKGPPEKRFIRVMWKKVGERWLADVEQERCPLCAEGKCGTCRGTGMTGNEVCAECKGKKICPTCKGIGWLVPE